MNAQSHGSHQCLKAFGVIDARSCGSQRCLIVTITCQTAYINDESNFSNFDAHGGVSEPNIC